MAGNEDSSPTRKRKKMITNMTKAVPRSRSNSSSGFSCSEDLEYIGPEPATQGMLRLAQEQRKTRRKRKKKAV